MSKSQKGKKHLWQIYPKYFITCQICNNQVRVPPSHIGKQRFCSNKCRAIWQQENQSKENSPKWRRINRKCEYCGKRFVVKGDRINKGLGRFCSLKCFGIWQRIHMPKKETSIEKILNERLKEAGLNFETQKPIGRIAVVDFLVKGKLIIQADGDYWHSLDYMKTKDERQDRVLKQMGYIILRFLGSKIKSNPDECIKTIKEYLTV